MTTDVSSSPRSRRGSDTWSRVLVEDAIDVGAEPGRIDCRGSGERAHDDFRRDEAATPERDQLTHGRSVAGNDEGLALVERSHDLAAVVPELALGDLPCHVAIVARVRRKRPLPTTRQRVVLRDAPSERHSARLETSWNGNTTL